VLCEGFVWAHIGEEQFMLTAAVAGAGEESARAMPVATA